MGGAAAQMIKGPPSSAFNQLFAGGVAHKRGTLAVSLEEGLLRDVCTGVAAPHEAGAGAVAAGFRRRCLRWAARDIASVTRSS